MTCTDTRDVRATVEQIRRLETAGCDIVRVAVPDEKAAACLGEIKKATDIPLVADVHFNYRLALAALEQGADKIRINPGNIGSRRRVEEVVRAAMDLGVPIRIGVNAGSLEKSLLETYGMTPRAMVESALHHLDLCEKVGFDRIVLSIKSSDVSLMIRANQLLSRKTDFPLHLGVTEAGTPRWGAVRSAVGLGSLLSRGIGDTIRVSLTGDPVLEVKAGYEILKCLHLRSRGVTIVSCPTCGRLQTDLVPLVEAVEEALSGETRPLTVAIMGCAVNGPGEAREADLGVACGKKSALFFKNGEVVRKIREEEIVSTLVEAVKNWSG
jgi:(E)-4-hydroxy-3-methylbut-2-enyl-diphosphate synthase